MEVTVQSGLATSRTDAVRPPLELAARRMPQPLPRLTQPDFARLFEEHSRALWCVAVAVLGGRDGAEDVLQESAIVGLQKREEFLPGTSFVHWMSQIVRFTALNESRRRRVRAGIPQSPQNEPADPKPPPDAHEPFDDLTLAALATLEETPRICLLMRIVLDMSYHQIAQALDLAEGTAMSHVHRSRQRLRTYLLAHEALSAVQMPVAGRTSFQSGRGAR